jgi:hypothetical protein
MHRRPATIKEGFYKAARAPLSLAFPHSNASRQAMRAASEGRAMFAKLRFDGGIGFRTKKAGPELMLNLNRRPN